MQMGSHVKGKGKPKGEKNKPSSQILGVICIFYKTHEKKRKEKEGERMRKGEENARLKGPSKVTVKASRCVLTHTNMHVHYTQR